MNKQSSQIIVHYKYIKCLLCIDSNSSQISYLQISALHYYRKMNLVLIQSQTDSVPIYIPKRPLQVLKIQFPQIHILFIRLVKVGDIQYLEISIFGQETLQFYFYDMFERKTLRRQIKSLFKKSEQLLYHLFEAQSKYFSLKWPKKDGNAFVKFKYFKDKQIQAIQFQVTRRMKTIDTLLSLKTQHKLLQMKKKQKQIVEAGIKLELINFKTSLLKASNLKYQLRIQSKQSQQRINAQSLQKYDSLEDNAKHTQQRVLVNSSFEAPVQKFGGNAQKQFRNPHQNTNKANSLNDKFEGKKDNLTTSNKLKAGLNFSQSFYIQKFEVLNENNKLIVIKTASQKKFYHLHHSRPLTNNIEEITLIPEVNKYYDLTFGLLGCKALRANRMEWPMELIAYVGCTHQIINGLKYQKIPVKISIGDLLMVRVNLSQKKVYFLVNGELLGDQQQINEQMTKECYFFYETSTQGNRVVFPQYE